MDLFEYWMIDVVDEKTDIVGGEENRYPTKSKRKKEKAEKEGIPRDI